MEDLIKRTVKKKLGNKKGMFLYRTGLIRCTVDDRNRKFYKIKIIVRKWHPFFIASMLPYIPFLFIKTCWELTKDLVKELSEPIEWNEKLWKK